MKYIALILSLIVPLTTFAGIKKPYQYQNHHRWGENQLSPDDPLAKKVIILTIPKAGTHLIKKVIELITDAKIPILTEDGCQLQRAHFSYILSTSKETLFCDHLMPSYDFLKNDRTKNYRKVIMIRDLRDVVVSSVHWMKKSEMSWMPLNELNVLNSLPFNERLSWTIRLPDEYYGTKFFAKNAVQWMQNPTVFICRFEDLVGPHGGGTRERQELTIRLLAIHIGYDLTPEKIADIADHLFGGTFTFHIGQIGSWGKSFNQSHVDLFKQTMGLELIQLGYVPNNSW